MYRVRYPVSELRGLHLRSTAIRFPERSDRFGFTARCITKPKSRIGPSDKWPVLFQHAGGGAFDRPRVFYPGMAFLPGTRPLSWESACRQTVSLQRTGVPKPTQNSSFWASQKWKEKKGGREMCYRTQPACLCMQLVVPTPHAGRGASSHTHECGGLRAIV